jgi:spore maturation protein CgeB
MRISFFGSSLVSAYWNGAATYYRGILRALAARGHVVTFFEPDAYDRQQHRDIPDPPWAKVVVYPAQGETGVGRALAAGAEADLVVKASGVGVFDPLLEAAVLELRRRDGTRPLCAFWDVDAPATLERVAAGEAAGAPDPFRALVPRYDVVFTYGGGPPVVAAYRALGARACVPIYNGLDPDVHLPAAPDPRFAGDLGFLGNRLPDREARVEEFFLRAARARPERTFVLGGAGWQDRPLPPNVRAVGHVYTRDHNAFNASTTAVLNVNRDSMARFGHSPATRVFEAAGAGACVVTDAFAGVETFFEPEREILVARDGDEVAALAASLTPERARAIGAAARRRALAAHTYDRRALRVEEALEALRAPGAGGAARVAGGGWG